MSGILQIPKWAITVGAFLLTLGSLGAGVVSAGWAARGVLEKQTNAIAALRQTINETVKPALAKVEVQGAQLAVHDTKLAVHESRLTAVDACCDRPAPAQPLPNQSPPGRVGFAGVDRPALAPDTYRLKRGGGP